MNLILCPECSSEEEDPGQYNSAAPISCHKTAYFGSMHTVRDDHRGKLNMGQSP